MAQTKSSKKRKAENETAPEVRKRRKEERDDTARTNAVETRAAAIKEAAFNWESAEGKRKMEEVNKRVNEEIDKMKAEGRFGEIPLDPQEAAKEEKSQKESMSNMGINPERLAFIQSGAAFVSHYTGFEIYSAIDHVLASRPQRTQSAEESLIQSREIQARESDA